ncbi:MAG: hypothetical protein U5K43_06550 [Halofilum sp. (in: g-proteobacteria)]|nr:hypothetical protein [Halofilum sp. (in: g-proteobacteria)]
MNGISITEVAGKRPRGQAAQSVGHVHHAGTDLIELARDIAEGRVAGMDGDLHGAVRAFLELPGPGLDEVLMDAVGRRQVVADLELDGVLRRQGRAEGEACEQDGEHCGSVAWMARHGVVSPALARRRDRGALS